MYTASLRKVGGSVMLSIPPAVMNSLHLQAGASVSLAIDAGRLWVEPLTQKRYRLEELLAQCDPSAELSPEDQLWLNGGPVGNELL